MTNVMPTLRRVSRRRPFARIDGEGEEHEDRDRKEDRQLANQLDSRLHRPQLIRLHDHDAAGLRAETLLDLLVGQADAVGQLLDDRRQVEHDLALPSREELDPRRRRCG